MRAKAVTLNESKYLNNRLQEAFDKYAASFLQVRQDLDKVKDELNTIWWNADRNDDKAEKDLAAGALRNCEQNIEYIFDRRISECTRDLKSDVAKLLKPVTEAIQQPFNNNLRNQPNTGPYVLNRAQYEADGDEAVYSVIDTYDKTEYAKDLTKNEARLFKKKLLRKKPGFYSIKKVK